MKVLLTGATSGIGLETLKKLTTAGIKVIALGRDFSNIQELIEENQDTVQPVMFDLRRVTEIEELYKSFNLESEKLDGLIHCAGIEETIPLKIYHTKKIQNIFEINVFSAIELLRVFSKKKNSNSGGSVVFLSSVMGSLGQPGILGYCATKAALLGVMRSASLELAPRKIRVNTISPGVVETPMSDKFFEQLDPKNIERIKKMHPLGLGNIADVVSMIFFLMTQEARWITGQNITIDGGYSIQ